MFAEIGDSTGNAHDVSISFGAQHTVGDRLAIYGELGLAYERSTGVGVVVYF